MKTLNTKIFKVIYASSISIIIFFSSINNTFSSVINIESLLNLETGIEEYKINLINLNKINLNDSQNKFKYRELRKINKILKKEIIKKYKNGKFNYYQINGIIENHKKFIYYSNKYFYYLSLQEKYPNYIDLSPAILKNYINLKSSFVKIQNLAKK